MIKEVVRAIETGDLALVGLFAFLVAFVLIVARVLTMHRTTREHAKQLPLEDDAALIIPSSNHDE